MTDITSENARSLRQESLWFFGKISASLSHEINNAVSIITEYSGLLSDLLSVSSRGAPLDLEKVISLNEKIRKQVKKGEALIKRFNKFAHSADRPVMPVELKELMENIVALSDRLLSRKGIRVKTVFPEQAVSLNSSPFMLQQAVFRCFEMAMTAGENTGDVGLSVMGTEEGATIVVSNVPVGETSRNGENITFLHQLMGELDGRVETKAMPEGNREILFHVPDNTAANTAGG